MPESPVNHSPYGVHIAMECAGCREDLLRDRERLKEVMVRAAEEAGATVVDSLIHAYNPAGLSGVVVIEESHLAIHTWPEIGYASFDIYTCGERKLAHDIAILLEKIFEPKKVTKQELERRPPTLP